jgi:hypothetical protein
MRIMPRQASTGLVPDQTVYVWQHLGEDGGYAICKNRDYTEYQTAKWTYRGELMEVGELAGVAETVAYQRMLDGWPITLHKDTGGSFTIG